MGVALEINDALFGQIDRELAGLAQVARMPTIKAGMRAGGNVTKRTYVDYLPISDDREEGKHLVETVGVVVKEYPSGTIVCVVGASYREGAHAHLLELGVEPHAIGEWEHPGFTGWHYLERAVQDSESERDAAVIAGMRKAIEEAKHG